MTFEPPIRVLLGLGFPCKIRSARAAVTLLSDTPPLARDEKWEATLAACQDAADGKPVDAAEAFASWARQRGILVEEVANAA